MSTNHDTFNGSSHGVFVQSAHGWRGGLEGYVLVGVRRNNKNIWFLDKDRFELTESYDCGSSSLIGVAHGGRHGFVVVGATYNGKNVWHFTPSGTQDWSYDTGGGVWCVDVDDDGNWYIGCERSSNVTLRKLDSEGNSVWTFDNASPGYTAARVYGLHVYDGALYLAGASGDTLGPTVWKLGLDGTEEWSSRHNVYGQKVCVRPTDGHVFLAGIFSTANYYYVEEYDPDGVFQSYHLYSGWTTGDRLTDIKALSDGVIYATNLYPTVAWPYRTITQIGGSNATYNTAVQKSPYGIAPSEDESEIIVAGDNQVSPGYGRVWKFTPSLGDVEFHDFSETQGFRAIARIRP